jgi:hypothetical protein
MTKACLRKEVSEGISDVKLFIKEGFKIIISGIVLFFPTIIAGVIMYMNASSPTIKFICTMSAMLVTVLWDVILGIPIITCYIYPKRDPYG